MGVSVMVCPCSLCTDLSIDLLDLCDVCFTVFVNCLVKQFAIFFGDDAVLFLNVMVLFVAGGGALLERP